MAEPARAQFPDAAGWRKRLAQDGFACIPAEHLSAVVASPRWDDLSGFWSDLGPDTHAQQNACWRKRRYRCVDVRVGADGQPRFYPRPAAPFIQESPNNSYSGVARKLEPCRPAFLRNKCFAALTRLDMLITGEPAWAGVLGVHQIRVSVSGERSGLVTPEGVHSDGHRFVAMHLIGRSCIEGGVSRIYLPSGRLAAEITLSRPGDTLIVDDQRCLHEVTGIRACGRAPAVRDMLLIDFVRTTRAAGLAAGVVRIRFEPAQESYLHFTRGQLPGVDDDVGDGSHGGDGSLCLVGEDLSIGGKLDEFRLTQAVPSFERLAGRPEVDVTDRRAQHRAERAQLLGEPYGVDDDQRTARQPADLGPETLGEPRTCCRTVQGR